MGMTLRFKGLSCLGVVIAALAACSSSSSSPPPGAGDGGDNAVAACDAVSLAPILDGGAAGCFECQTANCASLLAACSTDCVCAPVYTCLQQNSVGGINSGYSACMIAVNAQMDGNVALTKLAACATLMCGPSCFGTSADGG
jgi:hypothetical protein